MVHVAEAWIISGSIRLTILSVLLALVVLELVQGTPVRHKRILHWLNLFTALVMFVWFINLHGVLGMGWRAMLILPDMYLIVAGISGLYIGYMITSASYANAKLVARFPRAVKSVFVVVGIWYVVAHIVSVALTASTDDYRYSLLRHIATATALAVSGYSSMLIHRLKRMLGTFSLSARESLDAMQAREEALSMQQRLCRILMCSVPMFFLSIVAIVVIIVRLENEPRTYSDLVREQEENYDLRADLAGCWSCLIVLMFLIYYPWVPLKWFIIRRKLSSASWRSDATGGTNMEVRDVQGEPWNGGMADPEFGDNGGYLEEVDQPESYNAFYDDGMAQHSLNSSELKNSSTSSEFGHG